MSEKSSTAFFAIGLRYAGGCADATGLPARRVIFFVFHLFFPVSGCLGEICVRNCDRPLVEKAIALSGVKCFRSLTKEPVKEYERDEEIILKFALLYRGPYNLYKLHVGPEKKTIFAKSWHEIPIPLFAFFQLIKLLENLKH